MISFNLKMSIQKYSILCSWYRFFSASVSDFLKVFGISCLKIKNFEPLYLSKKLSCTNTFIIKLTCFEALYNIFKFEKIVGTFFFLF